MEDKILVGIIIGLVIALGTAVYNSTKFSLIQKKLTIPFLIFPPLGIVLIVIVWIFNQINNKDINFNNSNNTNSNIQVQPINFKQISENTEEKLKNINQKLNY